MHNSDLPSSINSNISSNSIPVTETIENIITNNEPIKENKKRKIICLNCDSIDILILCLNILIILLYLGSLIPCSGLGNRRCTWILDNSFFNFIGSKLLLSGLLSAFLFTSFIYHRKYYWHCSYMIAFFVFCFVCFNGIVASFHGFYSAVMFVLFFISFMIMFSIVLFILFLYKRKHYLSIFFIGLGFITVYILYHNNKILNFSCENWDYGLNNTKINNIDKDYPCTIEKPKKNQCYMTAFNGWFDWSKMINLKCDTPRIRRQHYSTFRSYLDDSMKNTLHFGFPITTTPEYIPSSKKPKFFKEMEGKIIDMEKYNKGLYPKDLPRPEVELIFDNKTKFGTYNITVRRNETLVKERREVAKNSTSLYDNVLIIYLDAVSRPNFFRKLPRTAEFLDKFTRYDDNKTTKDFSVFQFLKYHTLKPQTVYNIKPMFYGVHYYDIEGTNIVKYYKQQGFITGHTGTTCDKEIFAFVPTKKYLNKLDYDLYDHENVAMYCDRNFEQKYARITVGHNSQFLRCLHGKMVFEPAIEYTEKFWEAYLNEKKFFRIHMNEAHDGSNSLISNLDEPLFNLITKFYTKGWLNNTMLMIMSDHGMQLPGPWTLFGSQDYLLERTLGTLFFMIPNDDRLYKNNRYGDIVYNQQIFVTPFDIHDSLLEIAVGNDTNYNFAYSKSGQSLLKRIGDYKERYCESPKYNYQILPYDCQCH